MHPMLYKYTTQGRKTKDFLFHCEKNKKAMSTSRSLGPLDVASFGKRVFADAIKRVFADEIILDYLGEA